MDIRGPIDHTAGSSVPALPISKKAAFSEKLTRISESFKRGAIHALSPPKSGPGSGLVKRAKTDKSISTSGTIHLPDRREKEAVAAFHAFDVVPKVPFDKPPLTAAQAAKAKELNLQTLVSIQNKPKATRQDFNLQAWQDLDKVNFSLTQDHLYTLCELFNSPYHERTGKEFGSQAKWNESLIAETLAKALAYTEGLNGQKIRLPVKADNGYDLKEFTILQHSLGDNLPCYVLTCEGEKSWIIPRGTDVVKHRVAAMESILADCDPKGIASKVLKNPAKLDDILSTAGDEAIIAGHSLGGLLANEITARYPDAISQCYGFSAPGISKQTQVTPKAEAKIINFQTEGDLVPSSGRRLIGKNYAVSTQAPDAIHAHLQHNLNRPGARLTLIDNAKENQKLMRKASETTRQAVGGTILKIVVLFSKNAPTWLKNSSRSS